jgi:type II restriction/modification system DNA methylase subunit YeeA
MMAQRRSIFWNGLPVVAIGSDLTAQVSLDEVYPLVENINLCFRSGEKNGPFEISEELASNMLKSSNRSGYPNSNVIFPYFNAMDVLRRNRSKWLIDFGEMQFLDAEQYEVPLQFVREHVKPIRDTNNRKRRREYWWQHGEIMPKMRRAVAPLKKFIVTPLVSKHRLFLWLDGHVRPDVRLVVVAREDDYFFGALQSKPHELWSLRLGAQHGGERPTYNVKRCFAPYPFPWPPGKEPQDSPLVEAIAEAARELVRLRDGWLNPPEEALDGVKLKERTLTNLYNKRPDWLTDAHRKLDAAVFAAYGWPVDLTDDEILARLLELNLQRAAAQGFVPVTVGEASSEDEE